jgi:hypothetical protein
MSQRLRGVLRVALEVATQVKGDDAVIMSLLNVYSSLDLTSLPNISFAMFLNPQIQLT